MYNIYVIDMCNSPSFLYMYTHVRTWSTGSVVMAEPAGRSVRTNALTYTSAE